MVNIYEYDILDKSYENATGVVYSAQHKEQGQRVFIKKLHGTPTPSGNAILQESSVFKKISFPWYLPFTLLENDSNPLVGIRELPPNKSLAPLPATSDIGSRQKQQLSFQILSALDSLHRQGLMCADLQPCNLLADEHLNNIVFLDLSSVIEISTPVSIKKHISLLSAYYISPELTGRIEAFPDHRSDYYSFGVFLYEIFCDRKPFADKTAASVIYQHLTQVAVEPALVNNNIGLALSNVIMKLLHKNPDKRYATADGLKRDLVTAVGLMNDHQFDTVFELAAFDFLEHLELSKKTIGKEAALLLLAEGLNFLQGNTRSQFIVITGEKGTGKSSLVHAFEKDLSRKDILFIKGSFTNDRKVPYSGIREGCSQLVRVLLSMPGEHLDQVMNTMKKNGGPALRTLVDFLPEFSSLLNIAPEQEFSEIVKTNDSLVYAIAVFLHAVASYRTQLVFIWENFHLADALSLQLIDDLYRQDLFTSMLCIAIMEDGPQGEQGHPAFLERMDMGPAKCSGISLPAYSIGQVYEWLADSGFDPAHLEQIAAKIHAETGGIPAAIVALLRQLEEDAMLAKNEAHQWTIEESLLGAIALKIDTDEDRAKKMATLDQEETAVLQVAVLLTQPFPQSFLFELSEIPLQQKQPVLQQLIKKNFVKKATRPGSGEDDWMECADESMCQYIRRLMPGDLTVRLHYAIALLLEKNPHKNSTQLYELLSFVTALPPSQTVAFTSRLQEGAELALKEAAFQTALGYWEKLIDAYPKSYQDKNDEPYFDLLFKAAEAAIWAMEETRYQHFQDILIQAANTKYAKVRTYYLRMQNATKHADFEEVIRLGCDAAAAMDIKISTDPSLLQIIVSLVRLNSKVKGKSQADLEKIRPASDSFDILMIQVIEAMISAIFLARPQMLPVVMSIQIRKALQVGFSDSIGIAFMSYGFILSAFNPDFKKARAMSEISFSLHKKFNNPYPLVASRFIYGCFIQPWYFPLRQSKMLLEENYLLGRQVGNINLAFYSLVLSDIHNLFAGTALQEVLERSIQHNNYAANQRETLSREYFFTLISFCEELRQPAFSDKAFYGKNGQIEQLSLRQEKANNYSGVLLIRLFRNIIELLNEDYSGYDDYINYLQGAFKTIGKSSYQLTLGHFIGGLKLTRQTGTPGKGEKVLIKKALDFLKDCYTQVPVNHAAKYFCLLAAWYRKTGQYANALAAVNQAIDAAAEQDFTIELALAWEEKYLVLKEMNQLHAAQNSLRNAYVFYEKWGALAKLTKLRQQQSAVFIDKNISDQAANSNFGLQDNIDVANLVKASNSISGEIKLDQLLEKLFSILAETAGAQGITLLVYDEAACTVYTYIKDAKPGITSLEAMQEKELPMSVINYVQRSGHVLLVNDISNDQVYNNDPYFKHNNKASVLCLPLIKNRNLLGIVYMENKLTLGAFTEERLGLIKLLSTQMAISLENALLYESMEIRVNFRTEQLRVEKERSELLLLNILPRDIAEELKQKGTTKARLYTNVTVLFLDIKNFTSWSRLLDPETLVSRIDFYFRRFDEIITKYQLEKIKTVGDAYIAVGGLPEKNTAGPAAVIAAAIEMQEFVMHEYDERLKAGMEGFLMRTGVHIGPVVAGVVGSKKFAFDIWGDTVNIAARLQENGETGKVNISDTLYEFVRTDFRCTPRGKISIKNRGELDMFFVEGKLELVTEN